MSNRDESGHLCQPVDDPACIEVPVIELILARAADATLTHSRAWASVPKVGAGCVMWPILLCGVRVVSLCCCIELVDLVPVQRRTRRAIEFSLTRQEAS